MDCAAQSATAERVRVALHGVVQGIGFRPFVYRLARSLGLHGWTLNSGAGLLIEVQGGAEVLREFLARLDAERPAGSVIHSTEVTWLAPAQLPEFEIRASDTTQAVATGVLPDLATCPECLRETLDPRERRYHYPFTNCTNCGPRYSIVEGIPYDRPNTTMRSFELCDDCRREYEDPSDRRFHAQPAACPRCGPRLNIAIEDAVRALDTGSIVAWKGIGGYQLLVDATSETAVARLRERKQRDAKPFALMLPDLDTARHYCHVSEAEQHALLSPAAPIILLEPLGANDLASNVSDASPYLAVMLPYSPMHHLLMRARPRPIVATSGNLSGDPIAIDDDEARERLGGIADLFVRHDRRIARPCDDSVVRVAAGREQVLRRARGYAPLPVRVSRPLGPVLAVGPHMKNTVAIARGRDVYLSQHVGDLDTLAAVEAFERAIADMGRLHAFTPEVVACDLHPDYASTRWARECGLPVVAVQHHHAHAAACAAENDVTEPYLAVVWDGTGYGLDGTIWGGECFAVVDGRFERIAHLRPFRLPGGEAAVRQGWRAAAGLRHEMGLAIEHHVIAQMLARGVNAPVTTSAGRLFDAVASITGVAQESRFEGHAAMLLERTACGTAVERAYEIEVGDEVLDWAPLVEAIERDRAACVAAPEMARGFHAALARAIAEVARRSGFKHVVLSGGVFQNALLTALVRSLVEAQGRTVYTHQRVPPNDGGVALGQAVIAGVHMLS